MIPSDEQPLSDLVNMLPLLAELYGVTSMPVQTAGPHPLDTIDSVFAGNFARGPSLGCPDPEALQVRRQARP